MEFSFEALIRVLGFSSIGFVFLIFLFLLREGLPAFFEVPLANFFRSFADSVDDFPGPYFVRPDGYHSTAAAQPILARAIAELVRPVLEKWRAG